MLSTDALGAIHRLLNLGIQPFWLASTMVGVIYQQLIRKICPDCKEEYQAPENELALITPHLQSAPQFFSRGKGCQNCGSTGYKGRTAIGEIVSVSMELRDLILQQASLIKMREEAARHGFQGIRVDAAEKVAAGLTTISEFIRVLG
jgi:type IV pilus assembly protein PilB